MAMDLIISLTHLNLVTNVKKRHKMGNGGSQQVIATPGTKATVQKKNSQHRQGLALCRCGAAG